MLTILVSGILAVVLRLITVPIIWDLLVYVTLLAFIWVLVFALFTLNSTRVSFPVKFAFPSYLSTI